MSVPKIRRQQSRIANIVSAKPFAAMMPARGSNGGMTSVRFLQLLILAAIGLFIFQLWIDPGSNFSPPKEKIAEPPEDFTEKDKVVGAIDGWPDDLRPLEKADEVWGNETGESGGVEQGSSNTETSPGIGTNTIVSDEVSQGGDSSLGGTQTGGVEVGSNFTGVVIPDGNQGVIVSQDGNGEVIGAPPGPGDAGSLEQQANGSIPDSTNGTGAVDSGTTDVTPAVPSNPQDNLNSGTNTAIDNQPPLSPEGNTAIDPKPPVNSGENSNVKEKPPVTPGADSKPKTPLVPGGNTTAVPGATGEKPLSPSTNATMPTDGNGTKAQKIIDGEVEKKLGNTVNEEDAEFFEPILELNFTWPDPEFIAKVVQLETNSTGVGRFIAAAVSCNFLDMTDNWLSSLERLDIYNYLIIALDDEAYKRLYAVRPNHVIISPFQAVSKSATYGSEGFSNVVRSRPILLTYLLRLGYHVLYSDVDIFYTANPFHEMKDGVDVNGPSDSFLTQPPELTKQDLSNICTGLLYLAPTEATYELLARWNTRMIRMNRKVNQPAFNNALSDMGFNSEREDRIAVNVLDKDAFPPGFMYFGYEFWEHLNEWQPKRLAVMIHNNYAQKTDNKVGRFRDYDLWYPSGLLEKCG